MAVRTSRISGSARPSMGASRMRDMGISRGERRGAHYNRSMMRLVLDTNVVLDLFHWGNTHAVPIMAALEAGQIACFADLRTMDELQRVLTYPQLKLTPEMIAERYARYSRLVQIHPEGEAPPLPRCKDRDDQKFLELSARCQADLLVSKDKALLKLRVRTKLGFQIVKPAAAASLIAGATATRP